MRSILNFISNMFTIVLTFSFLKWYAKMINHKKYGKWFVLYLIVMLLFIILIKSNTNENGIKEDDWTTLPR